MLSRGWGEARDLHPLGHTTAVGLPDSVQEGVVEKVKQGAGSVGMIVLIGFQLMLDARYSILDTRYFDGNYRATSVMTACGRAGRIMIAINTQYGVLPIPFSIVIDASTV